MDEWRTMRLGDLAVLRRGLTYRSSQLVEHEGIPFISLKCFTKGGGFRAEGLKRLIGPVPPDVEVEPGAVLIANTDLTRDGEVVGAPALVPTGLERSVISMDVSRVDFDSSEVDGRFLAGALASPTVRRFMRGRSAGSTVLHLDVGRVSELELTLPPLEEQRQIAEVLDAVDDAIRSTERLIAKQLTFIRALSQSLELGQPDKAGTRYQIEEIAATRAGGTPSRSEPRNFGGHIWWIKSGEVDRDGIDRSEERVTTAGMASGRLRVVPPDTPLVAMYGATAGAVGWLVVPATTNQAVLSMEPVDHRVSPRWLYWALRLATPRLLTSIQGSGQPNLNQRIIRRLPLQVPERAVQERAVALMGTAESVARRHRSECKKLWLLRTGLSEDLLSGRVRTVAA